MKRVPEPELMDSVEQTTAYAAADFSEPNGLFCQHVQSLLAKRPPSQRPNRLLDLGCGSGGLLAELAHALTDWTLVGVDAGPNMLALAQATLQDQQLSHRASLVQAHLPADLDRLAPLGPYVAITSNSLLHHLCDPMTLWQTIAHLGETNTSVVVMDLHRPNDHDEVDALVAAHTQGADDVLKQDFYNSLCAAWQADEVMDQLQAMGWRDWRLTRPSNRHWLVTGQL